MARKSLLTIKSNLRELKYSSPKRQPYIYTPLPAYNESGPNVYMGPDLMGRNGRSFAATQDFTRISRFFSDKSNAAGLFFITKQNALEKTSPKTPYGPARVYNPANTLAQVAVSGTGIHFDKRGLTPDVSGRQKYERATIDRFNTDGTNRLTLLYKHKIGKQPGGGGAFRIAKNNDNILIRYGGGPNSLSGIGFTTLRRYTNTNKGETSAFALTQATLSNIKKTTSTGFSGTIGSGEGINNFVLGIGNAKIDSPEGRKILGRLTNYSEFNRNITFGTGDPGQKVDLQAYYNREVSTPGTDQINLVPLYSSKKALQQAFPDMIKFFIGIINNDDPEKVEYMQFRAYIKNINDDFEAEWDSFKYLGRGENFYRYKGFDRNISFDFDVHVASRKELFPVYQKLNYLASLTAPDYSDTGYMRGNIIKLTIGDYINDTYGVLTGFSLGIPDEATWDIARNDQGITDEDSAELPTLINVRGFRFKPIHNFVPQLVKNLTNPEAKFISLGSDSKGYLA